MFGVEPRVVISGCAARAEATVALYAPKAGGSGAFGTWWNSGWDLEELEAFEEQKEGACDHDSLNMEITSKGTAAKSFKGFWSCSYVAVHTHNTYTCTPKKRRTQSEVQQLLMMLYYDVYNTYMYNYIDIIYILQYTNIEHLIQTLLAQKWKYLRHLFDPIVPWSHGHPLCTPGGNNQWRTKRDRLEEDKNLSEMTTTPGLEMKDPSKWGIFLLIRTVHIGSKA